MSIQDTPKVSAVGPSKIGMALAVLAATAPVFTGSYHDEPLYRREPRKKSTHKRKFKGSKAAKKASRKRKG